MTLTRTQEQELAKEIGGKLGSEDTVMVKEAEAALTRFIRKRVTEQSVMDRILPPEKIGPDDLLRSPYVDDKLYYMMEIEPDFPGAFTTAFNSTAPMMTMGVRRVAVSIDRVLSFRMQKDVDELLTHYVSLRDINADYQLKHVLRRFDIRWLSCINAAVGRVPGQVMATTNSVHYHQMHGGLSPQNLAESLKFIPRLGYDMENGLSSQTLLMNNVTFQEFAHWQFPQVGDTIGADVIKNGLASFENGALGLKIVVTIKRQLVPDGTVYHFADPRFIGQCLEYREPTMHVHQHDFSVSFYVSASRGGGIFVFGGLCRVDHLNV
jgi:hypothetical protein